MPDEQRSEQNRRRTGKLSTCWHKEASRLQRPANRWERLRWTRKLLHFQAWAGPWRNGGPAHGAQWAPAAICGDARASEHQRPRRCEPWDWWSRGSLLVLLCSGTCWPCAGVAPACAHDLRNPRFGLGRLVWPEPSARSSAVRLSLNH